MTDPEETESGLHKQGLPKPRSPHPIADGGSWVLWILTNADPLLSEIHSKYILPIDIVGEWLYDATMLFEANPAAERWARTCSH